MRFPQYLLILLALYSAPVLAAPDAVVDAVQMPAWVDQGGRTEPLAPGVPLMVSDRIRTGVGSRVYLTLADGSIVKVGENGTLELQGSESRPGSALTVTLNVLRGAFRLTTRGLEKLQRHAVGVRVGAVTAGIRGTDLWGKADIERDLICLIEGKISVSYRDGPSLEMNDPLTFFVVPKDQTPEPVAKVAPEKLREWATETEVSPGAGVTRKGGLWKVDLARAPDREQALALYEKVRRAGYAAELGVQSVGERVDYYVQITQLGDKTDADALAQRLASEGIEATPAH